jgi:hypothetical protein
LEYGQPLIWLVELLRMGLEESTACALSPARNNLAMMVCWSRHVCK